ncbi:fluoride efflux transporter CrcB [Methylomonas sp. MS20]|uniref:fluoride efflux transporter CrcB n=1 Tax=unclassified Methylomonas TaxID=2608980 RepID=UPI0008D9569D|nr:chromosome condensation protein CrcB [Methylomonas sp. LWB]
MQQILAIALGGSIGAVSRFLLANAIYGLLGRGFPHGTLFINVSGSFLMGFLTELMLQRFALAVEWRAAILVGFLGAYTTFSTFAIETLYLFEAGSLLKAFLNILLSTVLCLVACWVGLIWGRTLFADALYPWLGHGLRYGEMALALLLALLIATATEWLLQRGAYSAEWRAAIYVVLLGLLTVVSTLRLTLGLPEIRLEFQGLLSLFVVNAMLGVATVWLGSRLGNWLWQWKP